MVEQIKYNILRISEATENSLSVSEWTAFQNSVGYKLSNSQQERKNSEQDCLASMRCKMPCQGHSGAKKC